MAISGLGAVGAVRSYASLVAAPSGSSWAARFDTGTSGVPDSAYSIPAGASFVANDGSDRNPGTLHAPFRTIGHALANVHSGGTIVVRGGTYRESLGSINKRVTIQAYPHEQVWMKGSARVTEFTASKRGWVRTAWTPHLCHSCYPSSAIDRAYPTAGLPDQVFVDGAPLTQVTKSNRLEPGTFYVDTKRHQLVLGTNPSGHFVEATYFSIAMEFNSRASGSRLLGIGVSQYGPMFDYRQPAMVIGNTTNLVFDHDAFDWSATRGLTVYRPDAVVEHSVFLDNGANGLHANDADGLEVLGNRFAGSNHEHFSIASSATASIAAMKITSTQNAVIKSNDIEDNASTAVWLDINAYNVDITNNVIKHNAGFGVMYEISSKGLIAGNVISQNGRDGIRISGSTGTDMWNNTVVDNAWSQIGVYDDERTQHDGKKRDLGITWDTANVRAFNNVLEGGPDATGALWNSFDASRPRHRTTLEMVAADDHNQFVRPSGSPAIDVGSWQTTLRTTSRWSTLAELQSATGREQDSSTSDGAARPAGRPLPPDVAAAMDVGTDVGVGAPGQ